MLKNHYKLLGITKEIRIKQLLEQIKNKEKQIKDSNNKICTHCLNIDILCMFDELKELDYF